LAAVLTLAGAYIVTHSGHTHELTHGGGPGEAEPCAVCTRLQCAALLFEQLGTALRSAPVVLLGLALALCAAVGRTRSAAGVFTLVDERVKLTS
jgi:hypothetical protein